MWMAPMYTTSSGCLMFNHNFDIFMCQKKLKKVTMKRKSLDAP